jgi:carboxyl-terminal processing protease
MRRPLVLLSAGLVLAVPFAVGYELSGRSGTGATSVVERVREELAGRYYRHVPARVLQLDSVGAILSALGDPYTAYLPPNDYRLLRDETASHYSGIGATVLPSAVGLVVVSVPSGPAERAGIRVGDTIVGIDGTPARQLGLADALARILGPRGTRVQLEVMRGRVPLDLTVERDIVRAPVVHARLLSYAGGRWGVVRLSAFRFGAAQLLGKQIQTLVQEGAQGFVLDLRGNPGGVLDQAVAVASLFLDQGVIVSVVGAHHPHRVYRAAPGLTTRLPLVVLVDRYSASAAEIVTAALRDNHRATIVGERTYGKALVQSLDPLGDGGALELTVARYYTPAGDDISGVGVAPDVYASDGEALPTALRILAHPLS